MKGLGSATGGRPPKQERATFEMVRIYDPAKLRQQIGHFFPIWWRCTRKRNGQSAYILQK